LVPGGNERSENGDGKQYIRVKAEDVTTITAQILRELPVVDLTIEDPPIEDVIEQAFRD
jgi:ABC-2 type transport system ATP-binding protein